MPFGRLTAHMASQVYPQRIFDSLMTIRYKQGHPESKIVAIHLFDNPYGQPNTVPRGITIWPAEDYTLDMDLG